MLAIAEREKLQRNLQMLSDREIIAVSALVDELLNDEPPLTSDELEQIAGAEDDMANGRMIPWDELKRQLEALP